MATFESLFADKFQKSTETAKRAGTRKARQTAEDARTGAKSEFEVARAKLDASLAIYQKISDNTLENAPEDWDYRASKEDRSAGSIVKADTRTELSALHRAIDRQIRLENRIRKAAKGR